MKWRWLLPASILIGLGLFATRAMTQAPMSREAAIYVGIRSGIFYCEAIKAGAKNHEQIMAAIKQTDEMAVRDGAF